MTLLILILRLCLRSCVVVVFEVAGDLLAGAFTLFEQLVIEAKQAM